MLSREWVFRIVIAVGLVSLLTVVATKVLHVAPSLAFAYSALVVAVIGLLERMSTDKKESSEDRILSQLRSVGLQERRNFLDMSLKFTHLFNKESVEPVSTAYGPLPPGTLPEEIENLLVRWEANGSSGTLDEAADYFRSLETQCLLITGEPGAGKTVFASRMFCDLMPGANDSEASPPTPVWVPLTSYNPDTGSWRSSETQVVNHFRTWLIDRIAETLALPERKKKTVATLLEEGKLLPLLDGLDEMHPADSALVIKALNTSRDQSFIVTSRTTDYAGAVSTLRGQELHATHISLLPLAPDTVRAYLEARYRTVAGHETRWDPILAQLSESTTLLGEFLSLPWHLYLMTAVFDAPDTSPAEILDISDEDRMGWLIGRLVPAIVRTDTDPRRSGGSASDIRRWLHALAAYVTSSGEMKSYTAINITSIWRLAGAWTRWIFPSALIFVLIVYLAAESFIISSLSEYIFMAVIPSVYIGLSGTISLSIFDRLERIDWRKIKSLRFYRSLAFGLAFGLAVGLTFGLTFGLKVGLAVGLKVGLAVGLTAGNGCVWGRYFAGTWWLARRGLFPRRPALFFDWCLERGLMRQTGVWIEFRHRELLDYFAQPDPLTPEAE